MDTIWNLEEGTKPSKKCNNGKSAGKESSTTATATAKSLRKESRRRSV